MQEIYSQIFWDDGTNAILILRSKNLESTLLDSESQKGNTSKNSVSKEFWKKAEQFVWRKSNISYPTKWGLPIFSFRGMYLPIRSMYGIFSYIYLKKIKNQPKVGQYTTHGSYMMD